MTRINCIPPEELCDKHLVAERHELSRVFTLVLKAIDRHFAQTGKALLPKQVGIPENYTMGTGHVKFFYNKLGWLADRDRLIESEMRARGMNVTERNLWMKYHLIPSCWWNYWEPSREDRMVNRYRLWERLTGSRS